MKILCPKCMGSDVSLVGNTHYVCNNPECIMDDGSRTQFRLVIDKKIEFPYNQIFVDRNVEEFYRQPYLQLQDVGTKEI